MRTLAALTLAAVLTVFTGCSETSSAVNPDNTESAPVQTEIINETAKPIQAASTNAAPASAETSAEPAKLSDGKNTVRLIVCDDEVAFEKDTLVKNGKLYFAASDIEPLLLSYDRYSGNESSDGEQQETPEIATGLSLDKENGELEFIAWDEVFTVPAEPIEDEYMVALDDVAAALKSAIMEIDTENGYIRLYDTMTKIDLSDYEGKEIQVVMSGNPLRLEGQTFIVKDNEVYAPIIGTFENLLGSDGSKGAPFTSYWDETTLTAKISNSWNSVTIKAGEADFTANGNPKTAIAPLQQINGQYTLPLRSVAKALGAEVGWNTETETMSVFYASIISMSPAN
jgi:hypothetical protein